MYRASLVSQSWFLQKNVCLTKGQGSPVDLVQINQSNDDRLKRQNVKILQWCGILSLPEDLSDRVSFTRKKIQMRASRMASTRHIKTMASAL